MSSFRTVPGGSTNTPIGRAVKDYENRRGAIISTRAESYNTPRGVNTRSTLSKFPPVNYESYRKINNPPNIAVAVIIVVIIVVIIILSAYVIHCCRRDIVADPTWFDRITVFGGEDEVCPGCGNKVCTCNQNGNFSNYNNNAGGPEDEYLTGGNPRSIENMNNINGGDPVDVDGTNDEANAIPTFRNGKKAFII